MKKKCWTKKVKAYCKKISGRSPTGKCPKKWNAKMCKSRTKKGCRTKNVRAHCKKICGQCRKKPIGRNKNHHPKPKHKHNPTRIAVGMLVAEVKCRRKCIGKICRRQKNRGKCSKRVAKCKKTCGRKKKTKKKKPIRRG